ncbi:unnamed protein product, partial [marine sediment metagenome]
GNTLNIFMLVDRLTPYKEILFNAFIDAFEGEVNIDFNFYNYDIRKFEKLILANIGYYNYYVIMPHFNEDVSHILEKIPADKLLLLNSFAHNLKGKIAAVYQNFRKDVFVGYIKSFSLLRINKPLLLESFVSF